MDCSTCSEIVNAEFYLGFISGLYHPMHTLRPGDNSPRDAPWRQFTTGAPAALTQPSIASNIARPLAALQGLESATLGPCHLPFICFGTCLEFWPRNG